MLPLQAEGLGVRLSQRSLAKVPVIDIFAGPGGLGEGFASFQVSGKRSFRIKLSIEMDEFAYRTLLLRSFFRQFRLGHVPEDYYAYVRGDSEWQDKSLQDLLDKYPSEGNAAREEAWKKELKRTARGEVDRRIRAALGNRSGRPWILLGGPPCQAYSLVGRARMLRRRGDAFYKDVRHVLYREYLHLIRVHKPTVFVMENVKGLLSATSRDGARVLERILADLAT